MSKLCKVLGEVVSGSRYIPINVKWYKNTSGILPVRRFKRMLLAGIMRSGRTFTDTVINIHSMTSVEELSYDKVNV